ncbi:MAG: hypothetical protein ACI4M8_05995 [Christensenellales bacterium]
MEEDINLLLSYIETEINDGKKPLIGGGVIVNGTAILKLIDRIRAALAIATGEDKITQATQKAQEIIEFAEQSKAKLIDEDIATREARAKADRIVQQALVQRSRMERDLAENLSVMLSDIKKTVNDADARLDSVMEEAKKSIDSALARVNVKLD